PRLLPVPVSFLSPSPSCPLSGLCPRLLPVPSVASVPLLSSFCPIQETVTIAQEKTGVAVVSPVLPTGPSPERDHAEGLDAHARSHAPTDLRWPRLSPHRPLTARLRRASATPTPRTRTPLQLPQTTRSRSPHKDHGGTLPNTLWGGSTEDTEATSEWGGGDVARREDWKTG
ncbi:hypothetical protein FKM82_017312, partial [Ascaphus truei]